MAHLLVENFFNTRQFTSHTVNSSTVTSDFKVDRIANARRHSRNYWTPDGSNAALHVGVVCDRVRSADMLCIDRNSNLAGEAVRLWASSESDFATYDEYTFTVPSKTYTGNYASDKHPVRADDGAIVYRFPETAGRYWRFTVDAMGAGERPRIGGLWLGKSWTPAITPLPWDDEPKWLSVPEARRGCRPVMWTEADRDQSTSCCATRLNGAKLDGISTRYFGRVTRCGMCLSSSTQSVPAFLCPGRLLWRSSTCWTAWPRPCRSNA